MTNPKVSVIVPVFEIGPNLSQCIESIRNQTLRDIEILPVDGKGAGYGPACNKGLDAATGDYITIVEGDDFIEPTLLEEMHQAASDQGLDVLKAPSCSLPSSGGIAKGSPSSLLDIQNFPLHLAAHASVWSSLYRTAFVNAGRMRFASAKGALYADVLFRIRTFIEARKVGWLNRALYHRRVTDATGGAIPFDPSEMLERWEEAHAYLERRNPEAYRTAYEIVDSELVFDDYLKTFSYFYRRAIESGIS